MTTPPLGRTRHGAEAMRQAIIGEVPDLPSAVDQLTSGAAAVAVNLARYKTEITTGGTAGSEDVNVGDGTGIEVGDRKLIEMVTRTNASDVVNLDHANIANAAGVQATNADLDAAGEFVLLEWNGTKWQVIHASATIAP